jgi:hypothetical protein
MMVRFSPKLAEKGNHSLCVGCCLCFPLRPFVVHREFLGVPPDQRPRLEITWKEREADVRFGDKVYPGTLFDLPCVTETYKMVSKVG